ncbi:MAG: IS701 family transposase, partial [Trichodesmium sp. St5_bin8]|nr:IS701 family transposase [Trichodesmium sp. St5_bin8]
ICNKLTEGLQRQWGNKPLKTFTDADQAFRTAISFRFVNWLTNNIDVFGFHKKSLGYIWA